MLTFKVFRALALLAGFADDLDWSRRENPNNAFRLVVRSRSHDFDKGFDFLLLLVDRETTRAHVDEENETANDRQCLEEVISGDG